MTDTFNPPRAPSLGPGRDISPRVLMASFGDGYTQRAGDGLNAIPRQIVVSWENLGLSDADAVETFLRNQAGYKAFWWTDVNDAEPRLWRCPSWTRMSPLPGVDSISATFEQVFDI